jgi:hypothetical protein
MKMLRQIAPTQLSPLLTKHKSNATGAMPSQLNPKPIAKLLTPISQEIPTQAVGEELVVTANKSERSQQKK